MSIALVIQHVTRMRPIILSSVACLSVPYFFTPSHKRNVFRGEKLLLNINVIFSTAFVWNIYHSKKNWTKYDHLMYIGPHVNNRYSCQIVIKLEFSWQIFEKKFTKYKIS
jgi:hypothetical protein